MDEIELLFTQVLNCDRPSLYLSKDFILDKTKAAIISSALKRRIQSEPIQYILGKTEFMGLELLVDRNVFIPRPETEIMVEIAIKKAQELINSRVHELNIIDIGTGSGNIAISLAKFLPDNAMIFATDISEQALKVAADNARLNKVSERIKFIRGDLFPPYHLQPTTYNLIVSNLPYVATSQIDNLQPEIQYEPRLALDGGSDGLDFYRRLISKAPAYLPAGGFLILEMGFNQRRQMENIFQKSGNFEIIEVVKDYNGIDRVIVAQYAIRKWIN